MRNLKEIIIESLLDDEDIILKNQDKNIKASIEQFLRDNYKGSSNCKYCDSLTSLEDVPNQLKGKIIK